MFKPYSWCKDFIALEDLAGIEELPEGITPDCIATESFSSAFPSTDNVLTQAMVPVRANSFFNPVNITAEGGIFFATIYVCRLSDDMTLTQRLAIWFNSLKDTDHVKLSVAATVTNIPFGSLITLLGAIAQTKAKVEILLDQVVMDGLAYFYLLADVVTPMECGALFVQSYVDQRQEDTSAPWKAIHDFYKWIVEDSVRRGHLLNEEADRLHGGTHVIIPDGRFNPVY